MTPKIYISASRSAAVYYGTCLLRDGNKTRPIGVPTFEDKVQQRAVAMVLEAIYEQEFLDCSYGFRPGRSAHQTLTSVGVCSQIALSIGEIGALD